MDVDEYLKKIKCENYRDVGFENLKRLQQNHIQTFCFENLDMHMGKKISYDLEITYDRLINKSRGGYCLQLNSLFGWLLKQLGYDVFFTPCYIFNPQLNRYIRLPIHIIIIVTLDDRKYYIDVGTSRDLNEPIEICIDKIQKRLHGSFKFHIIEDGFYELLKEADDEWLTQIRFKLEPKDLIYFKDMNEYVQTIEHPTIFFRTIVVRHFENGMIFLIGYKFTELIFKEDGNLKNTTELTLNEVKKVLKEKFELTIPDSFEPVDNLDSYYKSLKN
jgi:N-hydroxyarylamine O-acetyltransferase